uniref:LOB domain-containing protein n=1 Tax=Tanacetum cinerariifolium TaxID=118510 RepID=A0A6L2LTB5_TANCI|nr:hypothetical protein [Tanacetum cinerariifolium]
MIEETHMCLREDAIDSLYYEAMCRMKDPVYGRWTPSMILKSATDGTKLAMGMKRNRTFGSEERVLGSAKFHYKSKARDDEIDSLRLFEGHAKLIRK